MEAYKPKPLLPIWLVLFFIVAMSTLLVFAIFSGEEKQDDNIIFSSHDMEVRAVCTVESGIIVTTNYNARIAGDAVSTVRMTEEERRVYCIETSEGNQEAK